MEVSIADADVLIGGLM
jgi:hypothetical protein